MRRSLLLAAGFSNLALGCANVNSITSWFAQPEVKSQREPALAAAARVDQIGRQILAANPQSGVNATFQVIGHADALIFHRDRGGIFISDTLVDQCKTDVELAAVLCTELGKMVAEQRNLIRMGYVDQFAQVPTANPMNASDLSADPVRVNELALRDKQTPRKSVNDEKKVLTDPKKIAAELMHTAGLDEKALAAVEPILKNANKNPELLKQLGGSGSDPVWTR